MVCKSVSSSENLLCATELGFHLFWMICGLWGAGAGLQEGQCWELWMQCGKRRI